MKEKPKILIIEDNRIAREMSAEILEEEVYEVVTAENGENGLLAAREYLPDLILLDLGLPDMEGSQVARKLKRDPKTKDILILVLSARDDEYEIVSGLESFADDYITKPYKEKMLLARVKAVLRRKNGQKETILKVNDLVLNSATLTVDTVAKEVVLSKTEFDILYILASKPGWIYSRDQINSFLKGDDFIITDRAVDMSIARLRKKLGDAGRYIETVRGAGYRLKEKES